jgi:hypothetical protein
MTNAKKTFKPSGKSIGGGKLTRVFSGSVCIGSINELSCTGLVMAHTPAGVVTCETLEQAKELF